MSWPGDERAKNLEVIEMGLKELEQFGGTINYYRHPLGIIFTDGVKYLAEKAGAYWLIDAIASWQIEEKVRTYPFQLWELKVNENQTATLTMREDTGEPEIVRQEIPFTDFPLEYQKLYLVDKVLMLPSEY